MKTIFKLFATIALTLVASLSSSYAGQYTGSAAACNATSTGTCSIDILDFMKSKYSYLGYTANSDNAFDNSANSFRTRTQARTYDPASNSWKNIANPSGYFGFAKHPYVQNGLMFSSGDLPSKGVTYFFWDGSLDNSIYVMSEGPSSDLYQFKTFATANTPHSQSNWQNRGYFWSEKKFDVSYVGNGKWTSAEKVTPVGSYYTFSSIGALNGVRLDSYNPLNSTSTGAVSFTQTVEFYSNSSSSQYLSNEFGGQLPTNMELVVVKHAVKNVVGTVMWFERYYYGRKLVSGSNYNSFGIVKWDHAVLNATVCANTALSQKNAKGIFTLMPKIIFQVSAMLNLKVLGFPAF